MELPDNNNDDGPMTSINITPLVDVMLVLLIIFMVTASLGQQGITVNLPRVAAKPLAVTEDLVTVSISADRRIFLNKEPVEFSNLSGRLRTLYAHRTDKAIFVKADQSISYGDYAKVMAVIKSSGVSQLGMVTEAPAP